VIWVESSAVDGSHEQEAEESNAKQGRLHGLMILVSLVVVGGFFLALEAFRWLRRGLRVVCV